MSELMERIEKWHIDKFGIEGPTENDALDKFEEELEELYEVIENYGPRKRRSEEATDVIITLVGYIHAISPPDITVSTIIEDKLEEIENRDGEVIDGQFIKEADLNEQ